MVGLIDTYGIELVHPRREGRSQKQIGKKGKSNTRWIVGGKLCLLVNHIGLIVGWACSTANVYDGSEPAFQKLVDDVADPDGRFQRYRLCQKGLVSDQPQSLSAR